MDGDDQNNGIERSDVYVAPPDSYSVPIKPVTRSQAKAKAKSIKSFGSKDLTGETYVSKSLDSNQGGL
jgi:hypothetical protein